ncbi:M23 family metallopeptidase [Candidatus Peregrinibacteria bacterium]|nr:M23 family metallopeptidase [Candidatus Peregrinibacteria bacterium]
MEIKISFEYPRPLTILVLVGIVVAFVFSIDSAEAPIQADVRLSDDTVFYRNGEEMPRGGPDGMEMTSTEYVRRLRLEQTVLARKTTILRYQLSVLERKAKEERSPEIRDAQRRLVALFHDERALESAMLQSLREMQVARDHAQIIAERTVYPVQSSAALAWPIEPIYGISAGFHDDGYTERFGFEHQAIDIPALQGSTVYAAADGIVKEVSDHGLGFNSVTIAHNGGMATLYGHVREFLVEEGQHVKAGDPIARSGGMPGTPGAGLISTGPHLHFEVIARGEPVDPLVVLPSRFFHGTLVRVPTELGARPDFSA